MKHIIDAKNESLGRVASEIAFLLQGKNTPQYEPHKRGNNVVLVKNVNLVKVTGRKAEQKIYYRHSGMPGHLKKTTYKVAFERNPEWVIRHAVKGMLPKNKLQKERLKMLKFDDSTKLTTNNDG